MFEFFLWLAEVTITIATKIGGNRELHDIKIPLILGSSTK